MEQWDAASRKREKLIIYVLCMGGWVGGGFALLLEQNDLSLPYHENLVGGDRLASTKKPIDR